MGLCKDCLHYMKQDRNKRVAVQENPFCQLTLYDGKPMYQTLAHAEDAEGYYAALYPNPDFGCVQFEAKVE